MNKLTPIKPKSYIPPLNNNLKNKANSTINFYKETRTHNVTRNKFKRQIQTITKVPFEIKEGIERRLIKDDSSININIQDFYRDNSNNLNHWQHNHSSIIGSIPNHDKSPAFQKLFTGVRDYGTSFSNYKSNFGMARFIND